MAARRPSEPLIQKLNIQKQPLNTVESASYLDPPSGETVIPASDLTLSSASSPVERKKKFRLPKIVLQDKKRPDFDVKSCIEIDPLIPPNDAEIHEHDLQCCPPCDPQDGKGSKYIVERSDWTPLLRAEPGDLACFLAGCPPGVATCEKHHPQRASGNTQDLPTDRQIKDDHRKDAQGLARKSAKGSVPARGGRSKPNPTDNRGSDGYITNSRSSPQKSPSLASPTLSGPHRSDSEARQNDRARSSITMKSPRFSEQESSVTSGSDAFPNAVKSSELGVGKADPLSTSIVTNFTLGGVRSKAKYAAAKEATRKRRSATRSQGGVDFPEPLRLEQNRGNRSGSVARARAELERRSKSEGPPSDSQPLLRETGRAWEDTTLNELLGTSGKEFVRSMEEIAQESNQNGTSQPISKDRLRSMRGGIRSIQPRESLASKASRTGDTAPTEISEVSLDNREFKTAPIDFARIRTNDSLQYLTGIGGKPRTAVTSTSNSKPPSLVSSRSKASHAKHDLLKPSVIESQQVDTGLPLPPVLTPVPVTPEIIKTDDSNYTEALRIISDRDKEKAIADRAGIGSPGAVANIIPQPAETSDSTASLQLAVNKHQIPMPIVKNLTNIRKAQDLVDGVRGRLQQAEVQMIQEMKQETSGSKTSADKSLTVYSKIEPESQQISITLQNQDQTSPMEQGLPTTVHGLADCGETFQYQSPSPAFSPHALANYNSPPVNDLPPSFVLAGKIPLAPAVENKTLGTAQWSGYPISPAAQESLNAAYWGFVPAIKEAVQGILEVAVRNAVNEAAIAAAGKKDAVRNSAPEPREPVVTPKDELQRASMRVIPPTSQRNSESTVIRTLPNLKLHSDVGNFAEQPGKDLSCIQKDLPTSQSSPRESIASKGQENESSQRTFNPPSNESIIGCGQLETVPLDDSKSFTEDKPGWTLPTGWKNKATPASTPVPPRRSSKNQALVPKNKTPLSAEVTISPKTSVAPQESSSPRYARGNRTLRSISSAGSLGITVGSKGEDKEAKAPLIEQLDDETSYPLEKLNRANTVHWLKELLTNSGHYEPQFTALPPRMRKDADKAALKARIKSGKQSEQGQPGDFKALPVGPVVAKPKTTVSQRNKRAEASEAFTQTINDLELLMNEALLIARQAADTQDAPNALGNAAKILKSDRERSEEELRARYLKSNRHYDRDSLPSVHESIMSLSDSEASDMTDDTEFRYPRPPTPPPAAKRTTALENKMSIGKSASEIPAVVRSSVYYPRESQLPPNEMPAEGSRKDFDKITSADPRSMPLESGISDRRKKTKSLPHPNPNLTVCIEPRTSSKRGSAITNCGAYSDSDAVEQPEFRTLEFSRGRATTLKTLESGKSPRRLSPVKTGLSPNERASGDIGATVVSHPNNSQVGEYSGPLPQLTPLNMSARKCGNGHSEEDHQIVNTKLASKSVPGKRQVRDYIFEHRQPPIQERESSLNLRQKAKQDQDKQRVLTGQTGKTGKTGMTYNWQNIDQSKIEACPDYATRVSTAREENKEPTYAASFDGSNVSHEMDFSTGYAVRQRGGGAGAIKNQDGYELRDVPDPNLPQISKVGIKKSHQFNLEGLNHMSLKDHHLKGFSLARSHKKQKIARDWSPARKRFVAFVSCLSTSLIGLLVGIYAGETPSIQYYIVDLHHYTVLGNVFFFIGLAIPTFFFWPLPLLHGRKPYILGSMSLAMPLLFPQALAVGQVRSPYVATWRVALILPRAAMGFCLGFANMNFKSQLTDVFGASLQSSNPHQEHADEFDVRRHGGGMGIWLGLWTWSALGSIGVGFMIGAMVINHLSPAWGFYISITIIAFVMLLNVLVPETRRSAYRRSVAEVPNPNGDVSRRLARGEVKMHMVQTGPKWWGEEFHYGVMLTMRMLRQTGFVVMALYVAWIYGQMVLIILLLGALMSRDYKFTSPEVAASATAIPLGALLAIPFQKASIFSRARSKSPVSDDATLSHKKVHWSSHMVRRSIFILVLPFAGLGFTLSSSGPPVPFIIPILFAGLVGFLSNLAMAECHGILMETFDTSDLQPGMTGRARGSSGNKKEAKRTNYSSFPRVQSAFAITQGFGYLVASAASGVGGALTRHIGAQAATGVMAGILLILSLMLLGVLVRFTTVQIVPDSRVEEMEQYHNARRTSRVRKEEGVDEDEPFRPIIIGNPHHHTRRMCLLELGGLSRFSEIRIKNKLVDANTPEAKHPNRAAFMSFERRIKEKEEEIVNNVRRSLSRHSSRGSRRSDVPEPGDLGGFREMGNDVLSRNRSGNARGSRRDQLRRAGPSIRRVISE